MFHTLCAPSCPPGKLVFPSMGGTELAPASGRPETLPRPRKQVCRRTNLRATSERRTVRSRGEDRPSEHWFRIMRRRATRHRIGNAVAGHKRCARLCSGLPRSREPVSGAASCCHATVQGPSDVEGKVGPVKGNHGKEVFSHVLTRITTKSTPVEKRCSCGVPVTQRVKHRLASLAL